MGEGGPVSQVINYIQTAQKNWLFGTLLRALCDESPLFKGTRSWMKDADAYYVQPSWVVKDRFVRKSLVRFTSYYMDRALARRVNQAPVLVAHCNAQIEWLAKFGVRKPDAVISAGYQPNITVRTALPDKFTIGMFGNERKQPYLQDQQGHRLGNKPIKGSNRIPEIAKRLDPAKVQWYFAGPKWERQPVYRQLQGMGFEVGTHCYRADKVVEGYHKLDCLLIASPSEGGPGVGLDAFAAGLPVVSTRVGQMTELSDMLWDTEDEAATHILKIQNDRQAFFDRRTRYRLLVKDRTRKLFAQKIVRLFHEKILDNT